MLRRIIRILLALTTASTFHGTLAQTTLYKSPDGLFDVQAPSTWQVVKQPEGDVMFKNGAVTVDILVAPKIADRMSPKDAVDANESDLKRQCPTYRNQQTKATTLAGFPGISSVSTCSDPKSPAVADNGAASTPDNTLIVFTVISPLARYYDVLPLIDTLRDTLHLTGTPPRTLPAAEVLERDRIVRACAAGAFTEDECGRKIGIANGGGAGNPPAAGQNTYADPLHRFSVMIPSGWKATPEGDNGVLGVQLRSGSEFINIMPAAHPLPTRDAVLDFETGEAARMHATGKPPFGAAGIIQIFGAGLEFSYDSFSGKTPQGDSVEGTIGAIASIRGGNAVLLLQSSTSAGDPSANVLAVAQSIHLPSQP